jgi:hypothetical protein
MTYNFIKIFTLYFLRILQRIYKHNLLIINKLNYLNSYQFFT